MKTNRFEQGIISCIKIIGAGALLYLGFYIGTKLAKKMKIASSKDVDKYKGIGLSAKKYAHDHYGAQDIII